MRNLTSGKHSIILAHKRAKPTTKKNINVKVRKGKISRLLNEQMWIADHKLELKNGTVHRGRLIRKIPDKGEVEFEPEPKIKVNFKETEIKSLTPLQDEE